MRSQHIQPTMIVIVVAVSVCWGALLFRVGGIDWVPLANSPKKLSTSLISFRASQGAGGRC